MEKSKLVPVIKDSDHKTIVPLLDRVEGKEAAMISAYALDQKSSAKATFERVEVMLELLGIHMMLDFALTAEEPFILREVQKDGTKFWNKVDREHFLSVFMKSAMDGIAELLDDLSGKQVDVHDN